MQNVPVAEPVPLDNNGGESANPTPDNIVNDVHGLPLAAIFTRLAVVLGGLDFLLPALACLRLSILFYEESFA